MTPELEEARQMIRTAREAFERDAHAVLFDLKTFQQSASAAIGECSPAQALDAMKRKAIELFDQKIGGY